MFPLRDDNPSPRFPLVNLTIIVVNILISAFVFLKVPSPEAFVTEHGLIPARDLVSPVIAGPQWFAPFVSSMFLHGGFLHLAANMWSLWIFGDNVEGRMGPFKYFLFYLACGIVAALTHALLHPSSGVPVVGASGAISGVMGAYLFLFPRARIHMFTLLIFYPLFFELPAVIFLVLWFLGQLLSGAAGFAASQAGVAEAGGIAFIAHIGGFVAGVLLLPFFKGAKPRRTIW